MSDLSDIRPLNQHGHSSPLRIPIGIRPEDLARGAYDRAKRIKARTPEPEDVPLQLSSMPVSYCTRCKLHLDLCECGV